MVDFPAPFGPTSAVTEPAATDSETPNNARNRPYAAETSRSSSAGGSGLSAAASGDTGDAGAGDSRPASRTHHSYGLAQVGTPHGGVGQHLATSPEAISLPKSST